MCGVEPCSVRPPVPLPSQVLNSQAQAGKKLASRLGAALFSARLRCRGIALSGAASKESRPRGGDARDMTAGELMTRRPILTALKFQDGVFDDVSRAGWLLYSALQAGDCPKRGRSGRAAPDEWPDGEEEVHVVDAGW